jgi:hypothetical protein
VKKIHSSILQAQKENIKAKRLIQQREKQTLKPKGFQDQYSKSGNIQENYNDVIIGFLLTFHE